MYKSTTDHISRPNLAPVACRLAWALCVALQQRCTARDARWERGAQRIALCAGGKPRIMASPENSASPSASLRAPETLASTLAEVTERTQEVVALTGRRLLAAGRAGDLGAAEHAGAELAIALLRNAEVVGSRLYAASGEGASTPKSLGLLGAGCCGERDRSASGKSLAETFAQLVTQEPPASPPHAQPAADGAEAAGGHALSTPDDAGAAAAVTLTSIASLVPHAWALDVPGVVTAALQDLISMDSESQSVPEQVRPARRTSHHCVSHRWCRTMLAAGARNRPCCAPIRARDAP
jgi:hypothetical protein